MPGQRDFSQKIRFWKALDKNMELFSSTVLIILGCVALFLFLQRKNSHRPPCVKGWIPWIGVSFEFGVAPLEFIEKTRIKYGPIFTLIVMGNRMTFVTEEEGVNVFLKSKELNFELAVQNPIYHTASIPKNVFFTLHEKLFILMKGKLGNSNLPQFAEQLTEQLHEQLKSLGTHGTMDLNNLVRNLLYPSTTNILFGNGLFPVNKRKIQEFHEHFQVYDDSFEYGSQVPEHFLRNWSRSKQWLLALLGKKIPDLKTTAKPAKDNSMTLIQILLDAIETETSEQNCPKYMLLMLWAALSNVVPATFWTLAFVLSHPDIYQTVMEGISSVFGTAGKDKIKVSEDELKKLPLIKWCVLESIRLSGPGILARKVIKPVKILNYTVPSGDLLMLSPFWLHRNPKFFPEPESFKPERWEKANLEKLAFLDYFLAFGNGKYQCPGRWFALLEVQVCVILLLYKYDCSLLDPVPKQHPQRSVGILHPEGQCRIKYKERI